MATMKRLSFAAFLLLPLPCLAYGGFPQGATDAELLGGLAWRFALGMLLVAGPWIAGSIALERFKGMPLIAIAGGTALLGYAIAVPQLAAMGTFGYPHLIMPILGIGFVTFQIYFIGKLLWVVIRQPGAEAQPLPAR